MDSTVSWIGDFWLASGLRKLADIFQIRTLQDCSFCSAAPPSSHGKTTVPFYPVPLAVSLPVMRSSWPFPNCSRPLGILSRAVCQGTPIWLVQVLLDWSHHSAYLSYRLPVYGDLVGYYRYVAPDVEVHMRMHLLRMRMSAIGTGFKLDSLCYVSVRELTVRPSWRN